MTKCALAALLLFVASLALAAPPPDTSEGMLDFAASLEATGDTYRAATEYLRVLHHFGDSRDTKVKALTGLSSAYAKAGRWHDATETLGKLFEEKPDAATRLLLGDALMKAGRDRDAAILLLTGEVGEKEKRLGTLAWIKAGGAGEIPPQADGSVVESYRSLPRKDPVAAGILSALLPGAGHLYVDRPRDGTVAFVLNALFLWGTVESVKREEWALAGVLGAAEVFWYSGTIVGAVNGAGKWNRREEERFFERTGAEARPKWSLAPSAFGDGSGLSLSFNWR